jgi:peptide deformylase
MARLAILEYPDPRLRRRAESVRNFDRTLARQIDDLFETLYATRGIGLAAPQVGIAQRIVVIDLSGTASQPQVFVNPEILSADRVGLVEESCLSVPGVCETVKRATRLQVRWYSRSGETFTSQVDGLLAVCVQHEIDHLDGKLFVDRLPLLRRWRARRQLARARVARGSTCSPAPMPGTEPAALQDPGAAAG